MTTPLLLRLAALMLAAFAVPSSSALPLAPDASASVFITLGTMGGPISSPTRSQPANALIRGGDAYVIDAGDGAVQRLAAAGINLEDVRAVFLSHLHFDHTGGLAALLGLRYQTSVPGILTIYGPPGTKGLVHGLLESMHPAVEAGFGIPGAPKPSAEEGVRVIELFDGSKAQLPEIGVTAAENSHYSFAPGSVEAGRFKSLSYRFDLPERSIVYTGDTGPSTAVERLARSADLLVSEMIDLDATVQAVSTTRPNLPPAIVENLVRHLSTHHLLPAQVGELAARAGVKRVVVTHLVGVENESEARYVTAIHKHFSGPVVIAKDLDRF